MPDTLDRGMEDYSQDWREFRRLRRNLMSDLGFRDTPALAIIALVSYRLFGILYSGLRRRRRLDALVRIRQR